MKNESVETNVASVAGHGTAAPPRSARPRVVVLVARPVQHFCPMYRCIAADGRVELLVIFAEAGPEPAFDKGFGRFVQWQDDIVDGFSHVVVGGAPADRLKGVLDKLDGFAPDAIFLLGYVSDYLRAAMRWARQRHVPVMMTTDSELLHSRPWYTMAARRLVLPRILRGVDLFLTVGDENERYFKHYGARANQFHRVPFSIDSSYYDKFLAGKAEVRSAVRERLGIADDTVIILTVGKLIPRKRQADLLAAFSLAVKSAASRAVLLIAGDGPDREAVEGIARPLGDAVRLLGFIGVDVLPEYYLAADIYVHPSSMDPHPLAISEALYCGLPAVVSDRVGSRGPTDDIQVGRNGWVYPLGDTAALAEILSKLIGDPLLRQRAGEASQAIGELHAAPRCAALFVDGALRAIAERKRR